MNIGVIVATLLVTLSLAYYVLSYFYSLQKCRFGEVYDEAD
jgi:hypothetical protein